LRAPCLWPTGKHKHCWKQENTGDCDPEGEGLKEILEGLAVAEHHGEFNASRRKKLASVSGKLSIQPRPKEMALAAESIRQRIWLPPRDSNPDMLIQSQGDALSYTLSTVGLAEL
jgi:hypothetical protein